MLSGQYERALVEAYSRVSNKVSAGLLPVPPIRDEIMTITNKRPASKVNNERATEFRTTDFRSVKEMSTDSCRVFGVWQSPCLQPRGIVTAVLRMF